ncbi:MAG TPA: hypothetical protein VN328_00575 [Thermodesulfovibrionales bacterium]|nr:hypothetical protein [Thermodesulfovibrionales bacterium]
MKKIINLPKIAEPSIEQALEEFLSEQLKKLKPKTASGYRDAIQLFKDCMNGYAYQSLSKAETALFDKYYNAKGKEHKEFCQLFGPDKIAENTGEFLGYFLIRKVMAGGDFKRLAGAVIKKLSKWLAEKGYISEEDAAIGEEEGVAASRDLPKAEKAGNILYESAEHLNFDPDELDDADYHDFDHYTIEKVEPEKLWLEVYTEKGKITVGPIAVPKEATELLRKGWDISCAIARIRGKWRIVEVANVYPQ